jgi:hypothetical protein
MGTIYFLAFYPTKYYLNKSWIFSGFHLHWQNIPYLEDSARFDSVFTSSDFATIIFLQSKVTGLVFNPQPGRPGPCINVLSGRVAQLYPQALGSLFVAFHDSQGYYGGINITIQYFRIHMKINCSHGHHVDVIDGRKLNSENI